MFRFLSVAALFAFTTSAPAKGKVKKDSESTLAAPPASGCPRCPTPAPTASPFKLEEIVVRMFNYTEGEDFAAAAAMFAPGMVYLTNGQTYDIDLSMPEAVESIPPRWRTNFVWNQLDDHEIWAHAIVTYPDGHTAPEMIIVHVDDQGLIDLFSHVEPKSAKCPAIAPEQNFKLALQRVDGTIVDAPQDQLLQLLAEQQADPGYWADDQYYVDEPGTNGTNATQPANTTVTTTITTNSTNTTKPANATTNAPPTPSSSSNTTNTSRPILYIRNATQGKS